MKLAEAKAGDVIRWVGGSDDDCNVYILLAPHASRMDVSNAWWAKCIEDSGEEYEKGHCNILGGVFSLYLGQDDIQYNERWDLVSDEFDYWVASVREMDAIGGRASRKR